jgi:hypothetical protein
LSLFERADKKSGREKRKTTRKKKITTNPNSNPLPAVACYAVAESLLGIRVHNCYGNGFDLSLDVKPTTDL